MKMYSKLCEIDKKEERKGMTIKIKSTYAWPFNSASTLPIIFQMKMIPSAEPQAIFVAFILKEARAQSQLSLKCSSLNIYMNII